MNFLKQKKQSKLILTSGFALFAMFFGSGNLVFPLGIGVATQSHFLIAALGLFVTGISIPFIGLFSVVFCHKSAEQNSYFSPLGKTASFVLVFAMLSLMGPFGVGARCLLVASSGIKLMLTNTPDFYLNLALCVIVATLLFQRESLVEILGKKLTPILLLSIVCIIAFGVILGPSIDQSSESIANAWSIGISQGYQTMDLLAAFFFSTSTIVYLRNNLGKETTRKDLISVSLKACTIGAGLLSIVYLGFIVLGAKYSSALKTVDPEQRLIVVAKHSLGTLTIPIISLLISLTCITTLCVLVDLFADFLSNRVLKARVSKKICTIITLLCTFSTSLIGFTALAQWIASALLLLYPALIAFALARIIEPTHKYRFNLPMIFFWAATGACCTLRYFQIMS